MNATTTTPGWVLVVDGDPTSRLFLFRLLERAGYHATVVDDGDAALRLLRSEPFDLVLLDLRMPPADGYAVLQALKADERLRHLPVIVTAAVDDLQSVVRCIELGADDYLEKPIDPVLLRVRIGASLERKQLRGHGDVLDAVGNLDRAMQGSATEGSPHLHHGNKPEFT